MVFITLLITRQITLLSQEDVCIRTQSIEFESLFKQALDDGSDNMKHRDYYRYQTSPDCAQKLMECPEINLIVNKVQACINHQVRGYVASILYSLPGGKAQGWHEDDSRLEGEIVKPGMLLCAIVALQPDTKLDVWNGTFEQKTFIIPKGTMFVFGRKLVHSGSAYGTHNLRLHIYFTKSCDIVGDTDNREVFDNSIAHKYFCPVEDCPKHIQRCNLTALQMHNHRLMKHAPVEKMGWKRYEAGKVGKLHKCTQCVQTFLNVDGLRATCLPCT
jgi:hypothetical protein